MASDDAVLARLRDILFHCPDVDRFLKAHAHATDHGYGKATQPITQTRDDVGELDELRKLSNEELLDHFNKLRTAVE